jgi:hypothetical protein
MAGPEGRRPHFERTPTEQHKPHQEGGNGAPGIPPTLNEQAKPPPESSAHGESERTSVQQPQEDSELKRRLENIRSSWENLYQKELRTVYEALG